MLGIPLILCFVLFAVSASAKTGNEWRNLSLAARQGYVMGVLDAWRDAEDMRIASLRREKDKKSIEILSNMPPVITHIVECMGGKMTYGQIIAIVDKYIENNPEQWHHSMVSLIWTATHEACAPTPPTTTAPPVKKKPK